MPEQDEITGLSADAEMRRQAIKKLRARAGFWTHLLIFVTINTFIVLLWAVAGGGFFWPAFITVPWAVGLIANAWDVFGPDPVREDRVRREIERQRR